LGLTQELTSRIEPNDLAWKRANAADRRWLYTKAGDVALARLKTQLMRGIGANGRAMPVRKQAVLAPGVDGPVMIPRYLASRAITLSDYSATDRSLKIWWHAGTAHRSYREGLARARSFAAKHKDGKPIKQRGKYNGEKPYKFGEILEFHQKGLVRHAPPRDVRLSAASIQQIKLEVRKLWQAHIAGRQEPEPTPKPQPPAPPLTLPIPSRTPQQRPPGIAATGTTNLEHITFGIGADRATVERAIGAGQFTGFRKAPKAPPKAPGGVPLPSHLPFVPPGVGPTPPHTVPLPMVAKPAASAHASHTVAIKPVPLPVHTPPHVPLRPAPKAVQVAPVPTPRVGERIPTRATKPAQIATTATTTPTLATVQKETGLKFTPSYHAKGKDATVIVDIAKLAAALSEDKAFHVGSGGTGPSAKPGAYANAVEFLAKAQQTGQPVDMPRLALDSDNKPSVIDGRHRLAALLAAGVRHVPVTVPKAIADLFALLFGG
jgi:hypothetical protein